jgi:hypothetical protein
MNINNSRLLVSHGSIDLKKAENEIMIKCPNNIKVYFFEDPSNFLNKFKSGIIINWLVSILKKGQTIDKYKNKVIDLLLDKHFFNLHIYEGGDSIPDLNMRTEDSSVQTGYFYLKKNNKYFKSDFDYNSLSKNPEKILNFMEEYIQNICQIEKDPSKINKKDFINIIDKYRDIFTDEKTKINLDLTLNRSKEFYSNELDKLLNKQPINYRNRYYKHTTPDHTLKEYLEYISKKNKFTTLYIICCRNFMYNVKNDYSNFTQSFSGCLYNNDCKNELNGFLREVDNYFDNVIKKINLIHLNERNHEKEEVFLLRPIRYYSYFNNPFNKQYIHRTFNKNYELLFGEKTKYILKDFKVEIIDKKTKKSFMKKIDLNIYKIIIDYIKVFIEIFKGKSNFNFVIFETPKFNYKIYKNDLDKYFIEPFQNFIIFHIFNFFNCLHEYAYYNNNFKMKGSIGIGGSKCKKKKKN